MIRTLIVLLLMASAPLPCLAQAGAEPARGIETPSERRRLNAEVFDLVATTVGQTYYDPAFAGVDWRKAAEAARPRALAAVDEAELYAVLTALLDLLQDEHANVQGPSVWAAVARARAPRYNAGFEVQQRGARMRVVDVRLDSPADRAGVRPGWWLDRIDGRPFSLAAILDAEAGQRMTFGLSHDDGRTQEVTFVLDPPLAPEPSRRLDQPAPGAWRLAWDQFDAGVAAWVDETLAGLPAGAAVVLDLRGNTGGSMREFRTIAGCLLAPGTPLLETRDRNGTRAVLDALPGCRAFAGPVTVLVDGESVSAAELLPAVLREAGRAQVVGQRTAGSVLASRTVDLPDGGRLSVSRFDVRTRAGVRLEKVGLAPSVAAVTTFEDRRQGRDPALDAAIAVLTGGR